MIAVLLGLALAQDPFQATDTALAKVCDDPRPVAGTAGFANGLAAIRTNAQTYGAGGFARHRLRGTTYGAMDYHGVLGVTRVPSLCLNSDGPKAGTVYSQPMDLGATNLGLNAPFVQDATPIHAHFALFYASSVTTSTMGNRWLTLSTAMMNLYPAVFAPLVGQTNSNRSLTTMAVDFIGGATFKSDVISLQAGYTGSRGLYLDVTQDKVGAFVNTALTDQFSFEQATYLMGGVERFDPLELGLNPDSLAVVGMTSLFYRRLPQTEAPEETTGPLADAREAVQQLKTGHFRQEDMAQLVDLRAAWQMGNKLGLRELAVAAHTPNWHRREKLKRRFDFDDESGYVRLGMVNLPEQPLFGVTGGPRFTMRAVMQGRTPSGAGVSASLVMNDPDLLDIYPFAYNALGFNIELSFEGDDW